MDKRRVDKILENEVFVRGKEKEKKRERESNVNW